MPARSKTRNRNRRRRAGSQSAAVAAGERCLVPLQSSVQVQHAVDSIDQPLVLETACLELVYEHPGVLLELFLRSDPSFDAIHQRNVQILGFVDSLYQLFRQLILYNGRVHHASTFVRLDGSFPTCSIATQARVNSAAWTSETSGSRRTRRYFGRPTANWSGPTKPREPHSAK